MLIEQDHRGIKGRSRPMCGRSGTITAKSVHAAEKAPILLADQEQDVTRWA